MLQISGLNVYYGESHILRDVDLSVAAGKMVWLDWPQWSGENYSAKNADGIAATSEWCDCFLRRRHCFQIS